jgi:hypothetical protein
MNNSIGSFPLAVILTAALAKPLAALPADDAPKPPASSVLNPNVNSPMHSAGQITGKLSKSADGSITIKIPELQRHSSGRRSTVQEVEKDHEYSVSVDAKIRWHSLPKNPSGKQYTDAEYQALREPLGTPGYKAEQSDLKSGQTVRLYLSKAGKDDKPAVTTIVIVTEAPKHADKPADKK